ncbi:MAG: glycosyltransferase family 4 protein [Oscillospiraceae bacterium]|nr:glycosyltransferase family 4 protein [Oscillospiraceae bacterium]
MSKRILVVAQHYWPENFRITDICKGFVDDGIEVDVLCGLPNYPKGEWFKGYRYTGPRREAHEGAEIFRSGEIRRKGNTSARIFLNYVSFPLFALFHLPRLWGRRYDAIFCYETSPVLMMLPAVWTSKFRRVPLTTYVLDLWPENLYAGLPIKNKAARALVTKVSHWFYRRSDKLIGVSPAMSEKLRAIAPKRRVETVPQYCEDLYAADVDDPALRERFAGAFNVLFAGNISPVQDLGLLVKCAKLLKQAGRADIRFILVGDGMSRAELEKQIADEDVRDWFVFEGQHPVTDIPAYHTMADALFASLAPSEDVGLTVPAKITSYMAAGRPILCCIDGEASRVVREAGCGYTGAAGDAQALYENLIRLAALPPNQRKELGEAGRRWYQAHYRRGPLLKELERIILNP